MSALPHISVCICTFRRPELLKRLLTALASQATGKQFTFCVVIADNDRERSAEAVVAEVRKSTGMAITYCVEPRQNIALARNKALQHAAGDYVAFIDDDEFPAAEWLLTLLRALIVRGVDGVLGPVEPHFDEPPPNWVIRGKFCYRARHQTGYIIPWTEGRTGNVLFKRQILEGFGDPFRAQFGGGGEDRDFFIRQMEKGRVFMWCDEAVAYEVVPALRWRRSFVLKRALLRGKMSLNHESGRARRVWCSALAVPAYGLALPFMLLIGQHQFMKYAIKLGDHAGRLLAFLGLDIVREHYVTE